MANHRISPKAPVAVAYHKMPVDLLLADGEDHIRVQHYKSRPRGTDPTPTLGERLSLDFNLSRRHTGGGLSIPFFGTFASVEAYALWLRVPEKLSEEAESIRVLHGHAAMNATRAMNRNPRYRRSEHHETLIRHAIWLRLIGDKHVIVGMVDAYERELVYDIYSEVYSDDGGIPRRIRAQNIGSLCETFDRFGSALTVFDADGDAHINQDPVYPYTLPDYDAICLELDEDFYHAVVERDRRRAYMQLEAQRAATAVSTPSVLIRETTQSPAEFAAMATQMAAQNTDVTADAQGNLLVMAEENITARGAFCESTACNGDTGQRLDVETDLNAHAPAQQRGETPVLSISDESAFQEPVAFQLVTDSQVGNGQ